MASLGRIARAMLGRRFEPVGRIYRRFFVDLDEIAAYLDRNIPNNARVLDIGGGDGAVIDRLLRRRPDLTITMCDLATEIGAFLSEENRAKVTLRPATDFGAIEGRFDVVTITDVIHHIPVSQRESFFRSLAMACRDWQCRKLILKDIEPKGVRAYLSLFADRYITGDRHVVLFSRKDFAKLAVPQFTKAERSSAMPDYPNYCEILSW